MKVALLYMFALLFCYQAHAQQIEFKSNDQAVKYINDICIKYWLCPHSDVEISRDVTVYQHGCDLYFSEKSIIAQDKNAPDGKGNKVVTSIVNINLSTTKLIGNDSTIEFVGGKRAINTLVYTGNNEMNNKPQFSAQYKLSLNYSDGGLREKLNNLTLALFYLQQKCHAQPKVNKKHIRQ